MKFLTPSTLVGFTRLPPYCLLSESFSRSSALHLYPEYLRNLGDFSTNHSYFLQRRKRVLATLPFIQNYGLIQFKGREEMQRLPTMHLGVRVSYLYLPSETRLISVSSHLKRGFYLSLDLVRLRMISVPFWGCLSSHGVMIQVIRLLGMKNTTLHDLVKSILSHLPPEVVQTQEIQEVHNPTWHLN